MKKINENFEILFLDSISDDYYNLWEPYSELKRFYKNFSEENFKIKFSKVIRNLYDLEMISFYKGNLFNREEKEIKLNLTKELLSKLLSDWKNNDEDEIRITTTKKADNYLQLQHKLKEIGNN